MRIWLPVALVGLCSVGASATSGCGGNDEHGDTSGAAAGSDAIGGSQTGATGAGGDVARGGAAGSGASIGGSTAGAPGEGPGGSSGAGAPGSGGGESGGTAGSGGGSGDGSSTGGSEPTGGAGPAGGATSGGSSGDGGSGALAAGGSAGGPLLPPASGCPEALEPLEPQGEIETIGDGTPASCTETELRAAVASVTAQDGGGTVLFDCGEAVHTIELNRAIDVDGQLMLDGENRIVLSGGGVDRILNLEHYSELVVQRLVLRDGWTDESGGAIHHPWYGTLLAIDVVFENNHAAQDTGEIGGGAIFAGGLSEAVISGCSFVGNSGSNGGGVLNRGSTLTVVDTVFRDNEATSYSDAGGQYGNGGGLYLDGMAYEDVGPVGDFRM